MQSDEVPALVAGALSTPDALHRAIPGGHIRIDRHLPFLLLFRTPPGGDDIGARSLVESEASYLIADEELQPHVAEIIEAIASAQLRRFGAFLVVELWVGEQGPAAEHDSVFRIVAPAHGAPARMLEELETALLDIPVEEQTLGIRVEYSDHWSPPGLPPVVLETTCCHLGVEVPPVYRHSLTGSMLPFVHRALRHDLGRALRRGFHAFTHDHTPLRPAHFHELGPRAMTEKVYAADREIAAISASFDLVLHATPVNGPAAEAEFRASGYGTAPEFLYRARTLDPDVVKRRLFEIRLEHIDDPAIARIFYEKRDELDRKLTLVADRNSPRFLLGSRAVYGDPDADLVRLAERLVAEIDAPLAAQPMDLDVVAAAAEAEMDHYRAIDPTLEAQVRVRDDLPGVMVSQGDLLIGSRARVTPDRLAALMAHEVGTHVLTHHNGRQQPFRELSVGTAGYEALQEGLAVLWEYLVGGLDPGRLKLLAGRVLAVTAISDGADFVETFRALVNTWGFSSDVAFTVAMRVHRGGGLTKDAVYLRGLVQVLTYLQSGAPLERLHLGKVANEHLGVVEELEWRQILEPPRLLPRQLQHPEVQERIESCRRGIGVRDLVGSVS